jgi:hypothetical protein
MRPAIEKLAIRGQRATAVVTARRNAQCDAKVAWPVQPSDNRAPYLAVPTTPARRWNRRWQRSFSTWPRAARISGSSASEDMF